LVDVLKPLAATAYIRRRTTVLPDTLRSVDPPFDEREYLPDELSFLPSDPVFEMPFHRTV
jgi:hypothetical protein